MFLSSFGSQAKKPKNQNKQKQLSNFIFNSSYIKLKLLMETES